MGAASTQQFLDIAEIRQDTLILKDGSLRAVILVSSHNFALQSEDEQNALVAAYITMLNMLEYQIQVVIQSRKMNIDEYLNGLEEKARVQTNQLLKIQTEDYIKFMREIITLGNIMTKRFYVVVPYNPSGSYGRRGFFSQFFGLFAPTKVIKLRDQKFQKYRSELAKRVSDVSSGLSNVNLNPVELDTESLIELFYNTYNPLISNIQPLPKLAELQIET
ncbi:MAG: hypothetical protein UW39_C0011G0010 [Parcubacteria group bacterium GW2011_GWC2_44_17]|uniref:TraC-like domain-containing protein n=1 Tax=Candidatus Jacksonbacteria bacterium RIFCSPLOWO2_02_FULL_44_20 TaxID=1798460 RepID=A0A1G2A9J4_9BACT|nr:MAG: hypothetical protein UW39_C0011G0010 [Parcubacteria group bacterium GW2011_GWC2_44_17]OGY72279.1 MAG: hypothetical protein A3E05_02195 [Candidatus Jacksonbacteria bacterium RIFCSPHIGHO2_12_FULL_44_12]OGY72727.1 MAG: hypothetical protein A3H61_05085 [Candidatus Jacksonbacteria bacterium RIFCSPLOWO2_02_FULL_44_20]OGY72926.1 MAG: hypothetical protein A3H07_05275 [Candidatus Jacksonbacteria bacterium RIFCSPLOWO2_12_FULL_44_15b]HCA67667.1 hypothetical protein [Candidatus Jacksonbacteria bact